MTESYSNTVTNGVAQNQRQPSFSRDGVTQSLLIGAIISGLASVFTSTGYLVQFKHWAIIFPWQFPAWAIAPFALTGVLLFFAVVISPKCFWPVFAITAIPTAGMFVLRFPIFDEWLAGWVALGGLVAVITRAVPLKKRLIHPLWTIGYLLLAFQFTLLSLWGAFFYNNPKAWRFVLLNAVIFVATGLINFFDFPRPSPRKLTALISISGGIFCLLYLLHGLVFLSHVKTGILEGIGFATSGYQTAPFLVFVPAALILMNMGKKWTWLGGVFLFGLSILVTSLSDSRGGMLAILVPTLLVLPAFGVKPMIKIVLWLGLFSAIGGSIAYHNPRWFLDAFDSSAKAFKVEKGSQTYQYYGRTVKTARGDGGRLLYLRSGWRFLTKDFPFPAMTGAGVYGFFPVAGHYFKEISGETGIDSSGVNSGATIGKGRKSEPPRPPAAGALMVEMGWIGLGLLFFCAFKSISVAALRSLPGDRLILTRGRNLLVAGTVVTVVGFTFFSELQDMVLAFLLIMPGGLVHTWTDNSEETVPASLESRIC